MKRDWDMIRVEMLLLCCSIHCENAIQEQTLLNPYDVANEAWDQLMAIEDVLREKRKEGE